LLAESVKCNANEEVFADTNAATIVDASSAASSTDDDDELKLHYEKKVL
jgi:hypothetical protein